MKTNMWKTTLVTAALAGLTMGGTTALAQNAAGTPVLSPAAQQVLQMEQAKISDDIVIAYIRNSGSSYGLTADQIVYLRTQGVSSPVMTAMLNSAAPATTVPPTATPPAASTAANTTATVPATVSPAPSTTYVVPDSTTYYDPYYYSYPYYYGYGGYPPVSVNLGWGWHGGYGWHGDWHGGAGWHGGGGHGGWHR